MGENIMDTNQILNFSTLDEKSVILMNPLEWAYIGDAVYELYVRSHLISLNRGKVEYLHKASIKYVKAKAQSEILERLLPILTEEEQNIVRRGRNTKTSHVPKNSEVIEYRRATALEALIGYLFLMKRNERVAELMKIILEDSEN